MIADRMKLFLPLLAPYRVRLWGLLAITALMSLLAMAPPLITRALVDRVITPGDRGPLFMLGFAMITLPVLNALCSYLQTLGITYVGQKFVFDMRQALYQGLLRLSMRFFGKTGVGMLVNRLMSDTGAVQNLLTAQTITIVSDLVCAAFAITATFLLNWRLALVIVLLMAVFVLNVRLNIGLLRQSNRNYQRSMDRLSAGLQDRLMTTMVVKSYGAEAREQRVFRSQSDASLRKIRTLQVANTTFSTNTQLLAEAGRATIYFGGCAMVLLDRMTYGDVLAFTTYAMQLLWPAVRFSMLAKQIQDVGVAADRLGELFREAPEIHDLPAARDFPRPAGRVEFDHVDFHYEAGKPVIRDFHLTVQPGQTVALIGPTGCGKSTILSLLLRFYDATGGALRIDGVDVRDWRLKRLRRQFGIVLQEPQLFTASIADNIRYARPAATQADVEQAARAAEIHDFIMTLPNGYKTVIGVEGMQLSTGQKQRITIARAIAADPAILIMDEATSALDSESEQAIQLAMERVLKNRTAFIVAHRLSTIRNADVIVLMHQGRALEQGRHDALMALPGGRYAAIYAKFMGQGTLDESLPAPPPAAEVP
jgi:ABC-type multidrug transport system fused ATPase/permease subunit